MWWAEGCPGADIEDHIAELRGQGWTETALAIEREEVERLAIPGRIWPRNHTIARVFLHCDWRTTTVTSMAGSKRIYDGIDATEIAAVCLLQRIPRADWPTVLQGVRLMAHAAAPVINDRVG